MGRSLPVLFFLGASLLGLIACDSDTQMTELDRLAEGLSTAEVHRELTVLDLGEPSAREHLGNGWSWDAKSADGTNYVWADSDRAEVELFLAQGRDLEITSRCLAFGFPGAPPQQVSFAWNGHAVAETVFPGGGFAEFSFKVPGDLAGPGLHRLTLSGTYAQKVSEVLSSEDPRSLSFGCDWIRVGDGPEPEPPRGEGDTLWIPAGVEVAYFLEPSSSVTLEWQLLSFRTGNPGADASPELAAKPVLTVVWQVEGAEAHVTQLTDLHRRDAGPWILPVETEEPTPARLGLRVTSATGSGGVVLKQPRILAAAGSASSQASQSGKAPASTVARVGAAEAPSMPPILIWVVDTLRADRLGLYGHNLPVSPYFDALAERSTVFERAIAQSSWTRPTMATLLTGVGPERHGVHGIEDGLSPTFETLAEHFQRLGYATGGFSTNGNFSPDTNLDQGFDRFEYQVVDAEQISRRMLAWLDELQANEDSRPPLMVVLTTEPHASFEPAEPFRSRFAPGVDDPWLGTNEHIRALGDKKAPATDDVVEQLFRLYDAEIAWNDQVFGDLQGSLAERGLDPLIVVVADHGEAFHERGAFGHGWDLHREVLHIPFWIHLPGQQQGIRITHPVQQADLLPTLVEWVTGQHPSGLDGQSLVGLLARPNTGEPSVKHPANSDRLLVSTMDYEGRKGASLVRGRYKLIEPLSADFAPGRMLYDLETDPEELHDLSRERPILTGLLAQLLRKFLAAQTSVEAEEIELAPETREQLEALGYLG